MFLEISVEKINTKTQFYVTKHMHSVGLLRRARVNKSRHMFSRSVFPIHWMRLYEGE